MAQLTPNCCQVNLYYDSFSLFNFNVNKRRCVCTRAKRTSNFSTSKTAHMDTHMFRKIANPLKYRRMVAGISAPRTSSIHCVCVCVYAKIVCDAAMHCMLVANRYENK